MRTDEEIRRIEREVLDAHYKKLDFINYSDDLTIPYILKTYGDLERDRNILEKNCSDFAIRRILHHAGQAISQCLRWIGTSDNPVGAELPGTAEWDSLINEFLAWGMEYSAIAQEFVAWSRGLTRAELDTKQQTITFLPPEERDYYFLVTQHFKNDNISQSIYDRLPHELMEKEFRKWFYEIGSALITPPIAGAMQWGKAIDSPLFAEMTRHVKEIVFPELPQDTALGYYTLQQLQQLYTVLFINCQFIHWVERIMDANLGSENPFGSNPIDMKEEDMVEFLSAMSKVDPAAVKDILADLTFDHRNFHSSIFNQPFVKSRSGKLYFLPNLLGFIEPSRMVSGALNKGRKKPLYDKLINQIEKYHTSRIYDELTAALSCTIIHGKTIKTTHRAITPDLVLIDHTQRFVLVIDYKHFMTPLSASEVDYRIREFKKGVQQVMGYMDLLRCEPSALIKMDDMSEGSYSVAGLLLLHKPMPLPVEKQEDVNISDTFSLYSSLASAHEKITPGALLDMLASRKVPTLTKSDFFFSEMETKVNGWTFIRSVYASDMNRD